MPEKELRLPKVPDRNDPDYNHGCLVNLSEKQEYDRWLPYHPLSEARQFVGDLARIN